MMTSFLLVKSLRIAMMYSGVNVEGAEAYATSPLAGIVFFQVNFEKIFSLTVIRLLPLRLNPMPMIRTC
jgi:hypothetical protein